MGTRPRQQVPTSFTLARLWGLCPSDYPLTRFGMSWAFSTCRGSCAGPGRGGSRSAKINDMLDVKFHPQKEGSSASKNRTESPSSFGNRICGCSGHSHAVVLHEENSKSPKKPADTATKKWSRRLSIKTTCSQPGKRLKLHGRVRPVLHLHAMRVHT